ncbi:uncharacterized protein LOC116604354 [Nematostella vectensis]|uniref:uncharacterized protein LOC116604354 n=1 Tax=Nematostella vectensis TaxID=45351 RepID=UPI002077392A|nr:uncharacterized protein LOC116604354 [Nematostella vectensis]
MTTLPNGTNTTAPAISEITHTAGFTWDVCFSDQKIQVYIIRAGGIYQDKFSDPERLRKAAYFLPFRPNKYDSSGLAWKPESFRTVIPLAPGTYHLLFRIYDKSTRDYGDLTTLDVYDKTTLASGRVVNYIDVSGEEKNVIARQDIFLQCNKGSLYDRNDGLTDSGEGETSTCRCRCVLL